MELIDGKKIAKEIRENLKIKCPIVSIPNPVLNINKDILIDELIYGIWRCNK